MSDTPFWSDDFDMDLPRILPEARELMGALGDVELVTTGKPDKNGRLNHPAVWNGDRSMLAFFGFKNPCRPEQMAAPGVGEVRCTAWEAFRDAWPHQYLIVIERRAIWDTGPLWKHFETIMWDLRGIGGRKPPDRMSQARRAVVRSYRDGVRALERLVAAYPDVRREAVR
jgi:hypothetical protein